MISLKEAREQKNWTVDDLAAASLVSAETIASIEDGSARASVVTGLKLSKALGKATTEIIELAPRSYAGTDLSLGS